jgi:hypothetical protein
MGRALQAPSPIPRYRPRHGNNGGNPPSRSRIRSPRRRKLHRSTRGNLESNRDHSTHFIGAELPLVAWQPLLAGAMVPVRSPAVEPATPWRGKFARPRSKPSHVRALENWVSRGGDGIDSYLPHRAPSRVADAAIRPRLPCPVRWPCVRARGEEDDRQVPASGDGKPDGGGITGAASIRHVLDFALENPTLSTEGFRCQEHAPAIDTPEGGVN